MKHISFAKRRQRALGLLQKDHKQRVIETDKGPQRGYDIHETDIRNTLNNRRILAKEALIIQKKKDRIIEKLKQKNLSIAQRERLKQQLKVVLDDRRSFLDDVRKNKGILVVSRKFIWPPWA